MAGRQGFEPRSDGPEPPVLPLDDLPALGLILEKWPRRFKVKRGIPPNLPADSTISHSQLSQIQAAGCTL